MTKKQLEYKLDAALTSIESVRSQLSRLKSEVSMQNWRVDNPPKFTVGDFVDIQYSRSIVTERKISQNESNKYYWNYHVVSVTTGAMIWAAEIYLNPSKTQPL